MKRPENVTEAQLAFLDGLRESGATNMFGARRAPSKPKGF